ncbi:MAG: outer membrane lipoprotein carrier protein LolA [Akkermansiaceae bacterium]
MIRIALLLLILPLGLFADETAPLKAALEKQAEHKSVIVVFRQTKKVPALTHEIKTMGKLWLIPGKAFRWELGNPKKQTIIYNGKEVLVLDELKKTGERLSSEDKTVKPLFLTLGMGQDASFDGLLKLFTITSTNQAQGRYVATLSPKPRALKRVVKSLLMQVNLKTSFPERIGWVQRDGTEAMTEFFKPTLDSEITASTFQIEEGAYMWKG